MRPGTFSLLAALIVIAPHASAERAEDIGWALIAVAVAYFIVDIVKEWRK